MRQVFVIVVEHFLGHAVIASEVATVGHADAQVPKRAAALVAEHAGGWDGRGRNDGRAVAKIEERNDAF